jgi:hypothetical protein
VTSRSFFKVKNVRQGDKVTLSAEGLQTNIKPQGIQLLKMKK